MKRLLWSALFLAVTVPSVYVPIAAPRPVYAAKSAARTTVEQVEDYHGWPAIMLSNGIVEAIVVPDLGRVMQFRFVGDTDGPFFENTSMFGKKPDPLSSDWGSFGGDKTWPAPQDDWERMVGRKWPPPIAFDGQAVEAKIDGEALDLTYPVDQNYGIRARRRIQLDRGMPIMRIWTQYEKVQGTPVDVSVWVITQLKDPLEVQVFTVEHPKLRGVWVQLIENEPRQLQQMPWGIKLTRDAAQAAKVGAGANKLYWIGDKWSLMIESPRNLNARYPDKNCNVEVYTNPDPLRYVELETLGPIVNMRPGKRIEAENVYTLSRGAK